MSLQNLIRRDIEVVITDLPKAMSCWHRNQSDLLVDVSAKFNTERYRSGHNGADSKSVCANAHEGSNPSLCAKTKSILEKGAFLFCKDLIRGIRTQWSKQPEWLFWNGDRRFFQSITLPFFRIALKNSRTNPSLCAKTKSILARACKISEKIE